MAFGNRPKTEKELDAAFEEHARKLLGKTVEEQQHDEMLQREEDILADQEAVTNEILKDWTQVPNPVPKGLSYHTLTVALHLTTGRSYAEIHDEVAQGIFDWIHHNKAQRARRLRPQVKTLTQAMHWRLPLAFCKTYLDGKGYTRTSLAEAPKAGPRTVVHLNPAELPGSGKHILQCSGEEWYALIDGKLVWPHKPDVRHGTRTVFAYWTL